jgi:thiosulfate reductase cytochrome b subunit
MNAADFLLTAFALVIMCAVAWVAYNVGEGRARREYQSALATERGQIRRMQRDLDNAHTEITHLRRRRATHPLKDIS